MGEILSSIRREQHSEKCLVDKFDSGVESYLSQDAQIETKDVATEEKKSISEQNSETHSNIMISKNVIRRKRQNMQEKWEEEEITVSWMRRQYEEAQAMSSRLDGDESESESEDEHISYRFPIPRSTPIPIPKRPKLFLYP